MLNKNAKNVTIKTSWALSAFHLQLWQGVCWGRALWAVRCRCLGDGAEMMADDVRVTRDQGPGTRRRNLATVAY